MIRNYDATPAHLLGRAQSWYKLATDGITSARRDFSIERYVALCFSIEFLLKALICIDKNNAKANVLKRYGHNIEDAKTYALTVVQDQETKDMINTFFTKYPEFKDRNVVETRYGVLGKLSSYDTGALVDDTYPQLLEAADKAIHKEWTWRNNS